MHPSLSLVSSYRVGLDVSIALEFRTSRTNGVLLGISNQANDGLGLEIVEGKVRNIDERNPTFGEIVIQFPLEIEKKNCLKYH